jgi:predicted Zn finger-like uncharacterized protein
MAIRVECPSCHASFGVRDDFAGRQGRCPKCQAAIQVPGSRVKDAPPSPRESPETGARKRAAQAAAAEIEASESDAYDLAGRRKLKVPSKVASRATLADGVAEAVDRTRRTRTPKQILAAFQGTIEPVPTTPMYRLWVAIVAGFMILLPLAYLLIIAAVGYGVFYHATHNYTVFDTGPGHRDGRAAVLIYFVPMIAGAAIVAFLLKPLFARSTRGRESRALDPETEPLLFAFVDGIYNAVGAPRPVRIEVTGDVNAGARFDGGPLRLFQNDLVLSIGLPLVAGLDIKQFAGVLAHEFGHFSQGTGMRVSYLIRSINMWFARVVYERDAWDSNLARLTASGGRFGLLFGGLAMAAIWLTRRVLWVLMVAGHAASGFLSRQMEFDADCYEARMVGARIFTSRCWRLRELNRAESGAYSDIMSSWRQNRLPDNLPKLVLANGPQIPADVMAEYRKEMGQAKTGLFDTHPSDRDRIAHARAEATDGIFDLDGPATDVFRNFDSLARLVTFEFYRAAFGPHVTKEQLYPVAELVQTQAVKREGFEAFQKFFLHAYSPGQPLPLPWDYPAAIADPAKARAALIAARGQMEARRDAAIAAWKRWKERFADSATAESASLLLEAGFKIKAADFDLEAATSRAANEKLQWTEAATARAFEVLAPFTQAAARRLTTALAILESETVVVRIPDGKALRDEARALYPCAAHLGSRVTGETPPVYRASVVLNRLLTLHQQGNNQGNQALTSAILRTSALLQDRLDEFRWKVGDLIEYPFEHAEDDISLSRYVLAVVPPKEEVGLLLEAADDSVKRMISTYGRALGRLTHAAEEVEQALGLPPLELEPPEEDQPENDE